MDLTTSNRDPLLTQEHPDFDIPAGLSREQFRAMGTTVTVFLPQDSKDAGMAAVQTLFTEWEQTLSRFLPESELSRLNRHAGEPMVVSPLLLNVLLTALTAAHATQGVYDPTLFHQIVQSGYDRTFDALPLHQPEGTSFIEAGGGWRNIKIDKITRLVILPAGVGLDFGGIAKGMAVDASIARLRQMGITTALVNAGGDLAVLGLPPAAKQWQIAVQGMDTYWNIPITRGAMATSGISRRHWQQGQKQQHHLLDPRTGSSAQSGLWSVSVVADRCEQGEVAAKVAFILGAREGANFLRKHQLAGLLIHTDGTWETVEPWPIDIMKEN